MNFSNYISTHIAHKMRWHHENVSDDGIMCHLMDNMAWKTINSKWPNFSNDKKVSFNGKVSHRITPKFVKTLDILVETEGKEQNWGKNESKKIMKNIKKGENLNIVV